MRDLAAELPRVAAEVQADLLRHEIALVAKNSCVLIVKTYDNMFLDVYFCAPMGGLTSRVREGGRFGFKLPAFSQMKRTFWGSSPGVSQYPCKVKAVNVR